MSKAIMIIPNTKEGLAALKYLADVIVKEDILIRLVTKKEFDKIVENSKGE